MAKKCKGHSKKKRHPGVGLKYKPKPRSDTMQYGTKERKMARKRVPVSKQPKYIKLVSSTGKVKDVREDSL